MPGQIDWWESRFQDHGNKKTRGRGSGRADIPFDQPRPHTRDQPRSPLEIVEANARYFKVGTGGRYGPRPDLRVLRHLAFYCHHRSSILDGVAASRYADALLALSLHASDWIRPLDEWQPPEYGADRQFGSLLRHLLARYDVPAFMDTAWRPGLTDEAVIQQDWFKHVGCGESIRTASHLPIILTKRMAHHFIQAPDDYAIGEALRYGQVLGLGEDARLARSLLSTRLGTHFDDNDFWETVIRWFIEHPDIIPVHHGPIVDYLHSQKFVASVPSRLVRGQPRFVPPQPYLCMWGRTTASLLRAVERWHRQLASQRSVVASWEPCGIPSLRLAEEFDGFGRRIYAVTELISSAELDEEGAAMSHCVATYADTCLSGKFSIWSMTAEDEREEVRRLLTVQVYNPARLIVQARGRFNRAPTVDEIRIVTQWQAQGGPALSEPVLAMAAG